MHARKKGKSGSTKPMVSNVEQWLEHNNDEIINLIVEMAKNDVPASKIGAVLRDQYGVPDVKAILGKKITEVLEEKGFKQELPEGLKNLFVRALKLRKHMENNPHDLSNKRGMQLVESKIKRLVKYYKTKHILPSDFYYDVNNIELLLR